MPSTRFSSSRNKACISKRCARIVAAKYFQLGPLDKGMTCLWTTYLLMYGTRRMLRHPTLEYYKAKS